MKNLILIVIFFTVLVGCKQEEQAVNYVVLSGKVENADGGELKVNNIDGFEKIALIKEDGTFSDTLFIEENGVYDVLFERLLVSQYLAKGDVLTITFDKKEPLTSVKVSGGQEMLNTYFTYKAKVNDSFAADQKNYALDEAAFETKIKSIQNELEIRLNSLKEVPEDVKTKELRALNYGRLLMKKSYEQRHRLLTNTPDFAVSDSFKKELDFEFNQAEDYAYSRDYQFLLMSHISDEARVYMVQDSLLPEAAETKALSALTNEVLRNGYLYQKTKFMLPYFPNKEKLYNDFQNASTNEKHKAHINKLYDFYKIMEPGQPSPKFTNYENYVGGTTSLDDLKGKYVYIDVWATWCGPCKREIPFLKEIEEEYHGKNIDFVSISVDNPKDKDKWRKMVEEKQLGGIQLITANAFDVEFMKKYQVLAIPRFILIDPEGKIVNAEAPRPSSQELKDFLSTLNLESI